MSGPISSESHPPSRRRRTLESPRDPRERGFAGAGQLVFMERKAQHLFGKNRNEIILKMCRSMHDPPSVT
eukprot:gene14275-biopygen20095